MATIAALVRRLFLATPPSERFARVLLFPTWSEAVEDRLIAWPREGTLLITGDDPEEYRALGWETRRLRVAGAPRSAILAHAALAAGEGFLAVPARRAHEFMIYEAAFALMTVGTRMREGGQAALIPARALVLKLAIVALERVRGLMPVLAALGILVLLPVRVLRHALRPGRIPYALRATRAAVGRACSWRWRPGRSRDEVLLHARMLLSFWGAYLRDPGRSTRLPDEVRRVLVIAPDLIGDTITAMPLMRALHARFPGAQLDVLVSSKVAPLLAAVPVSQAIAFDPPNPRQHHAGGADHSAHRRVLHSLRATRYDLVVNTSLWPDRASVLNAIDATCTYCIADQLMLPYAAQEIATSAPRLHDRHLALAAALGADATLRPLRWTPAVSAPARPLIGLQSQAPFATRRWPTARLAEIARRLHEELGAEIVIFDREDALWRGRPLPAGTRFLGRVPLMEAVAELARCRLLVANEGGLGHVSGLLGVPSVLIYTSTSPEHWRVHGPSRALYLPVACSPCNLRFCPLDFACHALPTVDAVVAAALAMWHGGDGVA